MTAELPLLLDTCAAIWISEEQPLASEALTAIERSHRSGEFIYVSPITAWEIGLLVSRNRLTLVARPERWFQRYGVIAIIFGRHIPGFRVPITVAAGVLKVSYRLFAASVAVSTAIWAGVVMVIGINFGPRMGAFLRLHRETYWLWAAIVVVMVLLIVYRSRRGAPPASSASPVPDTAPGTIS